MVTTSSIAIVLLVASFCCLTSAAQQQLEKFSVPVPSTDLSCPTYQSLCANTTADRFVSVRSQAQCIHECQHGGGKSACVGVNYLQVANVCEIYNQCPAYFIANKAGCHYLQRGMTADQRNCSTYFIGCAYVIPEAEYMYALTSYNDQLFVGRGVNNQITIYNSTSLQKIRNINIAGAVLNAEYAGLAPSSADNCLYVSDHYTRSLYRLSLPLTTSTDSIVPTASWSLGYYPHALSVNGANNVLVGMDYMIGEYTSSGTAVRQLSDSNAVYQVVEQLNGVLAVSIFTPLSAVRLISTSGAVLKTYGSTTSGSGPGQMNGVRGLAVDKDGFILVSDGGNNRVLIMDPALSEARVLLSGTMNFPGALCLDQSKGRLYVGESASPYRLLVFENMFNIAEIFNSMKPVQ